MSIRGCSPTIILIASKVRIEIRAVTPGVLKIVLNIVIKETINKPTSGRTLML